MYTFEEKKERMLICILQSYISRNSYLSPLLLEWVNRDWKYVKEDNKQKIIEQIKKVVIKLENQDTIKSKKVLESYKNFFIEMNLFCKMVE